MRKSVVATLVAAATLPTVVLAKDLDVPIHVQGGDGQAATCATSRVSGLNPNGDNFLAVRSGPAEKYRELDELHNDEVVTVYEVIGKWAGVVYRTTNPDCYSARTRPISLPRKGWISTKWLVDVAG